MQFKPLSQWRQASVKPILPIVQCQVIFIIIHGQEILVIVVDHIII